MLVVSFFYDGDERIAGLTIKKYHVSVDFSLFLRGYSKVYRGSRWDANNHKTKHWNGGAAVLLFVYKNQSLVLLLITSILFPFKQRGPKDHCLH